MFKMRTFTFSKSSNTMHDPFREVLSNTALQADILCRYSTDVMEYQPIDFTPLYIQSSLISASDVL